MKKTIVLALVLAGCGVGTGSVESNEAASTKSESLSTPLPDTQCPNLPAIQTGGWRHGLKSYLIAHLGSPRHRGIDLVTPSSATTQLVQGEISYGVNDKALEDEWVLVYACVGGTWSYLGPTLTDGEGRFQLALSGAALLPTGQRDLFVSVWGDGTGARFLGVVAPDGKEVTVTDIDGTLTSSENAFPDSLITGATVEPQPNAAAALQTLADRGFPIVYVTARGRYFTQTTRDWLNANHFPRGALRLAPGIVTLPGSDTVQYKVDAMNGLGLPVTVGIGNRATDVQAYEGVAVSGSRTFVKLPEFQSELQPYLDSGAAQGVSNYSDVIPLFATF